MDRSEQHKAYLERNIFQRTEVGFVSKLIKKGGETYTPSSCFIERKESICEQAFEVIFGDLTLNIPYSEVKDIWKIDSSEIKIELYSTIVFNKESETGKNFEFEPCNRVENGKERMDRSEQHKAYLERNIFQRTEVGFVSKLIKKGGETYTPSSCFIERKESIQERTFKVVFGGRTLDIPYSKVKNIEKTDSGIKIEIDSTIVLDEKTRPGENFKFEYPCNSTN